MKYSVSNSLKNILKLKLFCNSSNGVLGYRFLFLFVYADVHNYIGILKMWRYSNIIKRSSKNEQNNTRN